MGSKIILLLPLVLVIITAIVAILLYFFQDKRVAFDSSWAIASYVGTILSGAAIGISEYLAFKKPTYRVAPEITSPMNMDVHLI
jgi:uncharacterized membrane protein